jgi:hypothetical protein
MSEPLRCDECGRLADELPEGWRALLNGDADEETFVSVFCPECAFLKFGPGRRAEGEV